MSWYMPEDGYPYNTDFIPYPDKPLVTPCSGGVWHIEGLSNSGYPFCDLMIGIPKLRIDIVDQNPYVSVFDVECDREDFNTNGLAILCPTEVRVHEVLNGEYSVVMKHPMDDDGKWKLILERNYLKVLGQIYTIVMVEQDFNAHEVTATAEHVFYQLTDGWIFPSHATTPPPVIAGSTGDEVLRNILMMSTFYAGADVHRFLYQYYSDIEDINYIREVTEGITPVAAILGGNGFCEVVGGQLFRDNFYFSVNSEMEDSDAHAFELRVGRNLHGIKRTVDVTSMCSYLRAYDMVGNSISCSWVPSSFPIRQIPHNIVRSITAPITVSNMEALFQYLESYFWRYCQPIVSYKFDIADTIDNPVYAYISNMSRYRVGDKGTVYDERLGGAVYLEITETVKDGITGRTLSFNVGSKRNFTRPANIPAEVKIAQIQPESKTFVWRDKNGAILKDKNGATLYTEVSLHA